MSGDNQYKLRTSLIGHELDVRAVAVSEEDHIVTASRDKTARLWVLDLLTGKSYELRTVYKGHSGYVTSVCFIPPSEKSKDGLTLTGSRDTNIRIYARFSSDPLHVLSGHSDTVSCLCFGSGILVSGSWDNTVKLWDEVECVGELKGHQGPVWAVAVISTNRGKLTLSASADKTIKAWSDDNKVLTTYSGHDDCVRGLSVMDEEHFLSCSNDASVRLWHIEGQCINTFYGHSNYVYSVFASMRHNMFATGSEDRSLRVWSSGGLAKQTIHMPAQSVWCVAILSGGDIVAGTSDGIGRIFTSRADQYASVEEMKAFEETVAACPVYKQEVGGIKLDELPGTVQLHKPGTKDGQTLMVREGDKAIAYSWSASKKAWEKVGEVVGGTGGNVGDSGKVLYEGKEYDYVFDVDIDAEKAALKLPYNRSEDPWMVAQQFIYKHELPQSYLDEIANFITKNASNISAVSNRPNYSDPFTGGSRYVPGGSSASSSALNGGFGGADPFTGSSRHQPVSSSTSQFFPQRTPLSFDSINQAGMLNKLKENNDKMKNTLTEEEVTSVVQAAADPSVDPASLAPLEKALSWPQENIWPVLDVLRLSFRSRQVQDKWIVKAGIGGPIVDLLTSFLPSSSLPTTLLTIRCLANLASHPPGREILLERHKTLLGSTVSLSPYPNKNMEIAAATLLLNYSVLAHDSSDLDLLCQILSGAAALVISCQDVEAQFRVLVCLGTLLTANNCDDGAVKALVRSLDIKSVIQLHAGKDDKVGSCAKDVLNFL